VYPHEREIVIVAAIVLAGAQFVTHHVVRHINRHFTWPRVARMRLADRERVTACVRHCMPPGSRGMYGTANAGAIRASRAGEKKAPRQRGFTRRAAPRRPGITPSMAALFPVMMNAHLVAFTMMLISLSGSDRAQGYDGCGNGENDFLHYRTLKSML
jgi:hypothetical protein